MPQPQCCFLLALFWPREPYGANGASHKGIPSSSSHITANSRLPVLRPVFLCPSESPWTLSSYNFATPKCHWCFALFLFFVVSWLLFCHHCLTSSAFCSLTSSAALCRRWIELLFPAQAVMDHSCVRICFTEHLLSASPSSRVGTYLVLKTVLEDRHI